MVYFGEHERQCWHHSCVTDHMTRSCEDDVAPDASVFDAEPAEPPLQGTRNNRSHACDHSHLLSSQEPGLAALSHTSCANFGAAGEW